MSGEGGTSAEGGAGGADSVSCELAATCTGDLSALGTGDFSIAFTITTTANVGSGIISQRAVCMHSKFWDIRLRAGTTGLSIELDDQMNYSGLIAPAVVNDGVPHEVRVCRKAGHVYVFSDGALVKDAENATSFTTLPALATSTTTCTALDGTVTLVGSVSNVCVGPL
jgi:hypothetical protein